MTSADSQMPTAMEMRTQLVLAQVRLMEAEDECDVLRAQRRISEELLKEAQRVAEKAFEEQQQYNRELASLRTRFAEAQSSLSAHEGITAELRMQVEQLKTQLAEQQRERDSLDAQLRSVISSRSWRWTEWFRVVARCFSRR